jgi:hypothetical protein
MRHVNDSYNKGNVDEMKCLRTIWRYSRTAESHRIHLRHSLRSKCSINVPEVHLISCKYNMRPVSVLLVLCCADSSLR